MRWAARLALVGLLAGVAANALAAPAESADGARDEAAASPSLDDFVGKKLLAIDGSSIALIATEGGLARQIVAPNGAVQKTNFRFLNDRLGTISDDRDASAVIGVFRLRATSVDVDYADGTSETLIANAAGGLSLETKSAAGGAYCTHWYPEGHAFSVEERKSALAQYAIRLGLSEGEKNAAAPARTGCNSITLTPAVAVRAKAEPHAEAALRPAALVAEASAGAAKDAADAAPGVPAPAAIAREIAPEVAAAAAKEIAPRAPVASRTIEVRPSEVQAIDRAPAVEPPAPQQFASLEPGQATGPVREGIGASSCLSVESDGMHWGFRNRCGFTVQFAYCVTDDNPLASCRDGAVTGSVASEGFGALLADQSFKESDASHHFRWVACQGGAGEVIPRLDQIDPPMGRCVH